MNFLLEKGRRVIIKLRDKRIFEGDLLEITKSEIHLEHVIECPEHEAPVHSIVFHKSVIQSVKILLPKFPHAENTASNITLKGGKCEQLVDVTKRKAASNTTLNNGQCERLADISKGAQIVSEGEAANNTTLKSGKCERLVDISKGTQIVSEGEAANNTTLKSGKCERLVDISKGTQIVSEGEAANNTTLKSGKCERLVDISKGPKIVTEGKAANNTTLRGGKCERLMDISKGQRIVIELEHNQIFEGDLLKATKTRIDVVNIMEYPERTKQQDAVLSFYEMEIISVTILLKKLPKEGECLNNSSIAIERKEYDWLMDVADQYIYLPVIDQRYIAAIDDLNQNERIGIVALWSNYGRFRRPSLLVLSTWYQVYIFDLKFYRLQKFPPELQAILEAEYKEKVVHGSTTLMDCLSHVYKIKLKNFFDTQIADIKIQKDLTGHAPKKFRNLSECLTLYFNFPGSFLGSLDVVRPEEWERRPLSNLLKHKAAQLATYLISLKNRQKAMILKDCLDAMNAYSHGVLDLPAVDIS